MCNPRRVRVTATREIAKAWQQEVRRQAHRTGRAHGDVRIREPLGATVGGPTLAALATVLANSPGWEREGDAYRHELDGGYVRYDPITRELEITATATVEVTVDVEESTTAAVELTDNVSAEGVGIYYTDGWGRTTEQTARVDAGRKAAAKLDAAEEYRIKKEEHEIDQREGVKVQAKADANAEAALDPAIAAESERLRNEASARLVTIGIEGRNLFYQALGTAYRDAIMAYARSRGADRLRCVEDSGVINIEFELDVH
jgi:hypothetical protein